jgi:hypothetical protein
MQNGFLAVTTGYPKTRAGSLVLGTGPDLRPDPRVRVLILDLSRVLSWSTCVVLSVYLLVHNLSR